MAKSMMLPSSPPGAASGTNGSQGSNHGAERYTLSPTSPTAATAATQFPMGDNSGSDNRNCVTRTRQFAARHACTALSVVLSFLLLLGGLLVLLHFRDLVDSIIKAKVPLKSDSEVTRAWLNPPITPALKLYFFNVTNPEEFLTLGAKPRLQEIGPYVYQEKWEKVNVSWLKEGQEIEYAQKKTFYFDEKNSVGSERDLLMLPNVPMITAIGKMKFANVFVRKALGAMLELLNQKPFARMSVRDVVWGFPHPLIKLGNDIAPDAEKLPFDTFGFFVGKNGTSPGLLKAITGIRNVRDVGQILSFAGKSELNYWKTDECNKIRGTDGSVFYPGVSKNDTLFIFNKDLCRSLPLVFQEEVVTAGEIPGFRFVPPSNVFATPAENPYNECFVTQDEGVDEPETPSGLFNMSICQFGAPIMLSWPHFFQADPRLLETVEGLSPSAEKHQFFLDIQPKLGTGLRAKARTQINVVLNPAEDMIAAKGLRDIIFPVVWFSDGIDGIDDEKTLQLLKGAIFAPETARSIAYPVLFALGVLVLVLLLTFLVCRRCSSYRRQKAEIENQVEYSHMATYKTGGSASVPAVKAR